MDQYLFLSSTDTLSIFSSNHAGDFKVILPEEIDCVSNEWELALIDYDLPRPPKGAYSMKICVDVCEPSICANSRLPVVRVVPSALFRNQLSHPIYIKIRPQRLKEIRIYLLDIKGNSISRLQGSTSVTLHLRQTPLRLV